MHEGDPKHKRAQTEEEYRRELQKLDLSDPMFTSTPEAPVDWCTVRGAVQYRDKLQNNPDRVDNHVEHEVKT